MGDSDGGDEGCDAPYNAAVCGGVSSRSGGFAGVDGSGDRRSATTAGLESLGLDCPICGDRCDVVSGFLAEGLERTGAGIGSVTIDSQPLIVAVLSCVLFRERIGWIGWLGLAIGVVGIAAIGLPIEWLAVHAARFGNWAATLTGVVDATTAEIQAEIQNELVFGVGEGLMLLASLSMAIGTVMMPKVSEHVDSLVATGWHMILGGVPLFVLSASVETQQWQNLLPAEWAALIYTTIFGSAIAYGLFFYFAARQNLISLSSLTFLTPVFALMFGYLLLSETLTLQQWCGVGLTLVGVYVIGKRHDFGTAIELDTTTSNDAVTLPLDAPPES